MSVLHVERVLPYSPDQLFALVGDVKTYPDFVRWITAMQVGPEQTAASESVVEAEAAVGFSFLTDRFSTRVTRDAETRTIHASLIRGPFRKLENEWRFVAEGSGARVLFDIDFAFKSRVLDMLLRANMGLAVNKLIACFEDEARRRYG